MKTISESIRTLRRERGFTQEALAEKLGVTAQSISKWESGTTLPDVSMIIPMASIFGVSTDVIFGVTPDSQEREIEEMKRYLDKPEITNKECVERWQAVVARYPNNYTARLELADSLHCLATEDGYDGDNFLPAIEQYERIVDECTDADIRSEAVSRLINDYTRTRRVADAVRAAKSAPAIHASREVLLAQINGSPTQKEDMQTLINYCVLETAWYLENMRYETPEDKIHGCETALAVLDAVYYDGHGDKQAIGHYRDIYLDLARALACVGRYDEMYSALDRAFEETAAYESLPVGIYRYTMNKFVAAAYYDRNIEPDGSDWVYLAYWITNKDFDSVRGDERFCEFEAKVRALVEENGQTGMLEKWLAE